LSKVLGNERPQQGTLGSPNVKMSPVLLVGVYALMLLRWPAAIIALVGVLEFWLRLRDKMRTQQSNERNE
jgi:hypothetical protein